MDAKKIIQKMPKKCQKGMPKMLKTEYQNAFQNAQIKESQNGRMPK